MQLRTALTAPTGRAAKRLSETCGAEASTIHRLLEPRYDSQTGGLTFAHNEREPLDTDAVILDEASMVDLVLMQALLAALPGGCRLVLVGDPHQLPSVGPGNLLSDLLRSRRLPTLRLTEIFRQAAASAIIRGARAVDQGDCPVLVNDPAGDFFFLRRLDPAAAVETIVSLCQTRLPQNMGISPDQIQVLSPTRKGTAGTAALNRALQEAVNPPAPDKQEKSFGTVLFREGDRVMQVKNNYDILWEDHADGVGMGIFNGDIGRIESIDPASGLVTVDFDGHRAAYPRI
ncbi:MAG: ATP-dependent RecD-like DNA helicase [Evtepia gabavorous]